MADIEELGCGNYVVMVQNRGGGQFFCNLQFTQLDFNRVLNEISTASCTVPLKLGCCECMADINPWQHELAIWRNNKQVWVGPIVDIEFDHTEEMVHIQAKDLLAWADHRLVELANEAYEPENNDIADIYEWLLVHAYCKDPWGMTYSISPVRIPIPEMYYPAFDKSGNERWGGQYPVCGAEMRQLSETGIDFTVVRRHLWCGSTQVINPVASQVILLDNHFQRAPRVKVAGSRMSNRVAIAGGQGGYEGFYDDQMFIVPTAIGPISPAILDGVQKQYGLLESFGTVPQYEDVDTTIIPNAVQQEAKTRYDLLSQPFVYIDHGILDPKCPLTFENSLIPGGLFNIELETTCRDLSPESKQMRLTQVSVKVNDMDEEVSIDLTPQGTTVLV